MGAQISTSTKFNENELLRKFAGLEPVTENDPLWNQLLSFNFKPPVSRVDSKFFEESINDLLEALMYNAQTTGNFASLVKVFLRRATELKASAQCEDKLFLWHTSNALIILRFCCKFLAERLHAEEFCKLFSRNFGADEKEVCDLPVDEFLGSLVEILADLPVNDLTMKTHFESLNCLISILTCELFSSKATASRFLDILMHGKCSIHAPILTKVLLNNFVNRDDRNHEYSRGYFDSGGGSVILGLAATFANVLQWGYIGRDESAKEGVNYTLAQQSLLALLVLSCYHSSDGKSAPNPYRQALFAFHNSQELSTLTNPTLSVATFKFDYNSLYEKLCSRADQEPSLLLLYLLVHRNLGFRNFVLSRVNIENVLFPLLKVLHNHNTAKMDKNNDAFDFIGSAAVDNDDADVLKTSCDSHHVYLALIILLMFSEDDFFCKVVHETVVKNLDWYSSYRVFRGLSLGSLVVLILLNTVQHNAAKVRDRYLQTNCLATLANMSANFKHLHSQVCQQLIGLLEHLCKRHSKLIDTIGFVDNKQFDATDKAHNENLQALTALEEGMRMLMEILNSCLTNNLRYNAHLIYTMLYKRDLFDGLQNHPMFQDLSWNISSVMNYFSTRVNALGKEANFNEILEVIQQGSLQWPTDRLKRFPELKFKYVEDANTEDFFVPYVWSLVFRFSGFYWESSKIKLFNVSTKKGNDKASF